MSIEIRDNGPGIKKSEMKHIFHPYLDKMRSSGTIRRQGVGLSISKYICKQLGGDLKIKSKSQEGTTVNFHFEINKVDGVASPTLPDSSKLYY